MAPTATRVAECGLDPYSDEFLADAHRGFRELRDLGPVVYLPQHDVYALTRYAEVREALTDWERFSSAAGVSLTEFPNSQPGIIHMDPPEHTAERELLAPPMSRRGLHEASVEIEATAQKLVAEVAERGIVDGVTELAQIIPVMIVSRLVGLPETGRERMLEWATYAFNSMGPAGNVRTAEGTAGVMGVVEYMQSEVWPDTVVPGSWADHAFQRGEELAVPIELMKAKILAYVMPSLDTTIQAIANALWSFGNNPDQWELLRERPDLLNRAINEVLRLESPVMTFSRLLVGGDHELGGVTIPDGARVLVMFASGNRDERKWEDPDRFDVTRDGASEHLAFGFGIHLCLGQGLARLEMRELFKALLARVERFEIGEYERIVNNTLHGFSRLEVRTG
jgi:cytochrome P450